MNLITLGPPDQDAIDAASKYVRIIVICKLFLSAIIIPIAIVAFFELPYVFDAFRTELRITPILRSALLGTFCIAVGLFCLKAFAVYVPVFGPVCGAPIHFRLWHSAMFAVGLLLDAMVLTPRMFLGSTIESLSPSTPPSNLQPLFSRQTHARLFLLIPLFAGAFYLCWHPGYSDFVAQARQQRRAELASFEEWRATLDEKLRPSPGTIAPADSTAFESLLPPPRVADQRASNTNSVTPSNGTPGPFQSEALAPANRETPKLTSRQTSDKESLLSAPTSPPEQNPRESKSTAVPEPPRTRARRVAEPASPAETAEKETEDALPNPFQKGTTWTGTSLQVSDGINPANDGIQIQVELSITRHDAEGFEGTVRNPSVIDAQGRRVRWGATASARGTYQNGEVTIRTTPRTVPAGTVLLPGTWTGTVEDGVFSGEFRGPNNSLSEVTLQLRVAPQRRGSTN